MTVEPDYLSGLVAEIAEKTAAIMLEARDERPLLSAPEVAKRCSVDPRTVRNWIDSGRLASVKLEGVRRVEPRVLDEFVASGRADA